MPIIIDHPSGVVSSNNAETVLEIGAYLEFHTDFVGPLGPGAFWTVEAWLNADPEHFAMRRKYAFTSAVFKGFQWQFGINNPAADGEGLGFRATSTAAGNATLRVQLDDPASGFHEQTQRVLQLTQPFEISARVPAAAPGETGFTATDRENLEVVQASVQVPFPVYTAAGGFVLRGLADLVQQSPLSILTRAGCQTLIGEGSITRPFGPIVVAASGLSWDFLDIPVYFGRKPGTLFEFEQRIAQFELIVADRNGIERTMQVLDVHSDHQFATWGLVQLRRVEYSITPGCEVTVCWLVVA